MITSEAKEAAKSLSIYFHIHWPTKVKSILFLTDSLFLFSFLDVVVDALRFYKLGTKSYNYSTLFFHLQKSVFWVGWFQMQVSYQHKIFMKDFIYECECLFYKPDKNHPNTQNAIKAIVCTMYLPECKYSTFQQCKSSRLLFLKAFLHKREIYKK